MSKILVALAVFALFIEPARAQTCPAFAGFGTPPCDTTPLVLPPPSPPVLAFTFDPVALAAWDGVTMEPTILPNLASASIPCFASPTAWTTAAIYVAIDRATQRPHSPPIFLSMCRTCETPVPLFNADGSPAIDPTTGLQAIEYDCGKKPALPLEFDWRQTTGGPAPPGSAADENVSVVIGGTHENGGGADSGPQP